MENIVRAVSGVLDGAVVAVDFDGTLAPITARPQESRAAPGSAAAMSALAAAGSRVAIVTGRRATSALAAGDFAGIPGLVVEGSYGAERWSDGRLESAPPPPGIGQLRQELPRLVAAVTDDPGVWIEDKDLSLVVHAREAREPEAVLKRLRAPLTELAHGLDLEAHPGKGVLEVRQRGVDKAGALSRLLRESTSAVVYLGDDVGDVPAFDAVHQWRSRTGRPALTVAVVAGPGSSVAGIADLELPDPAAVVALLRRLAGRAAL